MDSLRFVERDNRKLSCFIEVCVTLFPESSKSTVRSWLKLNEIVCENATLEEQKYFKQNNPYLSGSFGLIEHNDIRQLINFRNSPRKRQSPYSSSNTASTSKSSKKTKLNSGRDSANSKSTPESQVCLVEYDNNSSDSDEESISQTKIPENVSFSSPGSATKTHESKQDLLSKHPFPKDSFSTREDVEKGRDNEAFASPADEDNENVNKDRSRCQLGKAETPDNLKCELKSIRQFYLSPLNPKRESTNFSITTTNKMVERITCFMHYCKNHKNMEELSLSLYNDVTLVSEYVNYLNNVRKLMPSTIISILTVAINVVKYNCCDNPTDACNSSQILAYRRVQRQLGKEARLLSRRSKEGMMKKSAQKFYFAHILEVLRNLRTKYFESSGVEKSRYLHDFVLLATYLRAMPGRSQEIRTLQLFVESEGKPFELWKCVSGNFIIFHADSRVVLVQCEYKTAKSAGPTRIDITDDSELVRYLTKYLQARPTLLLGKIHNNFFVNCRGEPFGDSGAISKYLGDLFEREVSIRASTNMLRHSIVTYFKSIDESSDVNVRESLASLMKHSVRYQESVYNDMTHDEKTKKGRNLLREKLSFNVFGDEDDVVELCDEDSSDASENEEVGLRPNVGDICALIDPVSTPNDIHFFLGKVARFTDDREEAHLLHLEHVDDSEHLYKLKPGHVWTELTNALIFPIDIIYNSSERAYELRTSGEEMYKCVKGK